MLPGHLSDSDRADALYDSNRRWPVLLTPWLRFEFRNTVRRTAHEFSRLKKVVPFDVGNVLKSLDDDLKAGVLRHVEPDWRETFRLAEDISAGHTESNRAGSVDTWHIAAAVLCRADSFWTFDEDQADTARDLGKFKHVRP